MDSKSKRRVCSSCTQELAKTAFFRHLHDTTGAVCPGKRRKIDFEESGGSDVDSDRESMVHSISPRGLDSTFDLGSSDEERETASASGVLDSLSHGRSLDCECDSDSDDSLGASSTSSNPCCSSLDGEEVWEELDVSENDQSEQTSKSTGQASFVVTGIYYFLALFQLVHHLSERAINNLLRFIRLLVHYVGINANCNVLLEIAQALPKVMCTIRRSFKQDDFIEYVVCPKCCTLYSLSDCITHNIDGDASKLCNYIEFPHHPHVSRRIPCGEVLLKKVKVGIKSKLLPRKVFVYRSVVHSLMDMAKRPGFLSRCNEWQDRCKEDTNFIGDIYDGEIWKNLNEIGGRPFLALPNNLCLGLNIDWFRLYEHSPYSAGAIYLVVLNLPRNERFKEENVILAGIIPGPNEPKQINPFLSPLVNDLTLLYDGISFKNSSSLLGLTSIRATLTCIVCDLPATRKVCGFSNFNGTLGCSKCLKKFVTSSFGQKPQYGGFDCDHWVARDLSSHKLHASQYRDANTIAD